MQPPSDNGTVNRILALLSDLANHPNTTAKQTATRLGWPHSTAHRMLRMLAAQDFATQEGRGLFSPGNELYRIAGRLSAAIPIARLAEPILESLTARFDETTMLAMLVRNQLRSYFSLSALPPDPMRYSIELNRLNPLLWGASGRAILAYLTTEEVKEALRTNNVKNLKGQMVDADELDADLADIRTKGYATSFSHRTPNSVGIAAPFFDGRDEIAGSIVFQIPEFRFKSEALPDLVGALKPASGYLSRQLGSRIYEGLDEDANRRKRA